MKMITHAILVSLLAVNGVKAFAKTSAHKVKKETVEAVDTAITYVGEKKEEFAARMRVNIDEMDREIEDLKKESQSKSADVREAAKRSIADIQAKRDELNRRCDALEESTGRAWTSLKTGVEKAWGDVRSAYGQAKAELKEKK